MNIIQNYIDELKLTLDGLPRDRIHQVIEILHEARLDHQQVFIMGNGGSASTASHFVCDLGKNAGQRGAELPRDGADRQYGLILCTG
jgi:D-sedoheptulose 7-phosphate isomerase